VSKSYAQGGRVQQVLDAVSLDLSSGGTLALVGRSGCGKSTLLNIVAGLDVPDAGSVCYRVDDHVVDLARLSDRARTLFRRERLGFVFQSYNLLPTLTLEENVLLLPELNERKDLFGPALARLEVLGLGERLQAYPEELSGGEQQRVAIARALAHSPVLILADEPTGNLDVTMAEQVVDLLVSEVRGAGAALVLATHSPTLAARADVQMSLEDT
jgi:putative ABC transport system ATP-binding protein